MVTAAFLIAIIIALLCGFSFLGKLLMFAAAIAFYTLNLSFLFNSSVSTVVIWLLLGIGLMLFVMYVHVSEKMEQREKREKDNSQSNMA